MDGFDNLGEIVRCLGCRGQDYDCDNYIGRKTPRDLFGECYWYQIMEGEYVLRLHSLDGYDGHSLCMLMNC